MFKEKTLIDVMGLSEDENTCSRLLTFYFRPKEEHGLNELVLRSLVNILIEKNQLKKDSFKYDNVEVVREQTTLDDNRMDIIIKSNDIIIGIENKINADVKNDLDDYGKTLNQLAPIVVKVLLSKNIKKTNYEKTDFINILYSELAVELEKEMKKIDDKTSRWYLLLEEFVVTYLKGNNIYHYYSKEYPDKDLEEIDNDIENKVKKFTNIVNSKIFSKKAKYNHCVKLDLTSNIISIKHGINLDARLTPYHWSIAVYIYTNKRTISLLDYLANNNYKIISENDQHFILKNFDYDENIENVVDYYVDLAELLMKFN